MYYLAIITHKVCSLMITSIDYYLLLLTSNQISIFLSQSSIISALPLPSHFIVLQRLTTLHALLIIAFIDFINYYY